MTTARKWGLVTGASSGIGKELAREFVKNNFDVLIVADSDRIYDAAVELQNEGLEGCHVEAYQCDLTSYDAVEGLCQHLENSDRVLDAAAINAGVGVNGAFIDNALSEELKMIALNVNATVHLSKRILSKMVKQGEGRVLLTSSVAADYPSPYLTVYAATKSFIQSFAQGVRVELKDTGVTVTALQPGATDTDFFERAHMEDTPIGQAEKDDPAKVAHQGFEAMMKGKDHVVAGSFQNKIQTGVNKLMPEGWLAEQSASKSEPGAAAKHH